MAVRSSFATNVVPRQLTSLAQRSARLAVATALAGVVVMVAGCSAAEGNGETDENVGTVESALYGGVKDDGDRATNAVVALRVGDKSPFELCSGTLLAPNVVLTARHCVSKNTASEIDCDENGESKNGVQVGSDVEPRNISVMLGTAPDFGAAADARGKLVFRPVGDVLCNTDVAIVVLDKPITGIAPLAVRLKGGVVPGETMRAVGYGENDQKVRIGTRFRKEGITVLATGPKKRDESTGRPAVADREFEVGKSICQGDSGGPAISERTGAVIGVVSRGVGCAMDFGHIYSTTVGFGTLFREAFAAAGATPIAEVDPVSAPTSLAAPADSPTTNVTASDESVGAANRATEESSQGCSASPGRANGLAGAGLLLGLGALLLGARRRAAAPVKVRARRFPR